jgi:uncharacterized protein YlaN (UPF0358 family)
MRWSAERRATKSQDLQEQAYERGRSEGQGADTLEQRKVGIFGSKNIEAHNKGLRDAYIAGVDSDNVRRINEIALEHQSNTQGFDAAIDGLMAGLSKEVDPAVRSLVIESARDTANRTRLKVQENQFNEAARKAAESRSASATVYVDEAARLARNGDQEGAGLSLIKHQAILSSMLEAGDIGEDDYNRLVRDGEREATEQTHLGQISSMSTQEAAQWIEENKSVVPEGFTPDEWDSFIGRAESIVVDKIATDKAERQSIEAQDIQARNELEILIDTNQGNPEQHLRAIDRLYEGRETDAKYVALKTKVINKIQENIKKQDLQQASGS